MRYLAAILAVLLNVALASAQPVPWQPLPNTIMSTVYPNPLPQGANGPSAIIGAWNSAAFDTLRNQLLITAAGGHGDYAGNEVYAFQHATKSWARLTDPTPCLTLPSAWNYPSGDFSCDGKSVVSRHTYGGVAYNPASDTVWLSGGVRWHDGNPTSMTWRFHPATNAWEQVGVTMSGYFTGMALSFQSTGNPWVVWDQGGGTLVTANRWVYAAINETTNTAVPIACSGISQGPNGAYSAAIDPATRILYVLGGGHLRVLDLSVSHLPIPAQCGGGPFAQDAIVATTGATEIETLNINNPKIDGFHGIGLAWDASAHVLVAYGQTADKLNGRVYTFNPSTRAWTAWEAATNPPPIPTNTGVWNKLWFAADSCLYVVTDGSKPVYQACNLPWRGAPTYPVRVDTNGTGSGMVTGAGSYTAGTLVTLSASSNAGSTFGGWSGDPLCASGSFTMPAAAVSCVATFTLNPSPILTVLASGSGSVSGGGTYTVGQIVTISAWPTSGWAFTGWTGSTACPAPGTTTVTMPNVNVTCTATFITVPICQPPPPGPVSWTPILRPIGAAAPHPTPAVSATFGGDAKHMRAAYNSATGEILVTGGDHGSPIPGGTVGDGNGQPTVWVTRDLTSWRLLSPGCPASGPYPARPDTVIWGVDVTRNRAVIAPGFYFGIDKALSECANPNPMHTAMLFDLASSTWGLVPWPPPNPWLPLPNQYWGDLGANFGVVDPVTDSLYAISWNGNWGAILASLSFASNTWTIRNLGEQTATQPYNDALRNAYAAHAQMVLDIAGHALYSMTLDNKLFRIRLDVPDHRGEWVGQAPPQCVVVDDSSQEVYLAFDSDHRAVLRFCVPNTGGEVIGLAAYYVDTGVWAYYPAPTTLPYAVVANLFAYSPSCHCIIATGGHSIFTENPARPNPAPNPFVAPVPPGNQTLPNPLVDWQIRLG